MNFKNGEYNTEKEYEGEVLRLSIHNKTDKMENTNTRQAAMKWWDTLKSSISQPLKDKYFPDRSYLDSGKGQYQCIEHIWIQEILLPWWESYKKDPINWRVAIHDMWSKCSESDICNIYLKEQEVKKVEGLAPLPKNYVEFENIMVVDDKGTPPYNLIPTEPLYSTEQLMDMMLNQNIFISDTHSRERDLIQELRDALVALKEQYEYSVNDLNRAIKSGIPENDFTGLETYEKSVSAITKADTYLGGTK